ncbi:Borealin-2 [Bagarius yarrelli]|uniref:Borealin-2 n=1 Tax=Bagarius yarrelli TaxID=175774 RepID=A0A556VC69_BAGYA|nr:Borealin-2 [Bagarius yarrelli]
MAVGSVSPEIKMQLSRKPSKKGKGSTTTSQTASGPGKTDEKKKPRKKMQASNSTGNMRCVSTIGSKRTQGRVMKLSDQALVLGGNMRQLSRSLSDDLSGLATATITTSLGQELMEYLCNKVQAEQLALTQHKKKNDWF